MLGDAEFAEVCARELLRKAPDFDVLITAESKSIPLANEMARQSGKLRYVVARKSQKLYMRDTVSVEVKSITTANIQTLSLDCTDAALLKDRRVLIVDDVVSTGNSLVALEKLIQLVGGRIVGKMMVLAEGDAHTRDDLIYLDRLPLFNARGEEI